MAASIMVLLPVAGSFLHPRSAKLVQGIALTGINGVVSAPSATHLI
jgi:hypothetical protein